jgi:chlorobactene glucosyltransferase
MATALLLALPWLAPCLVFVLVVRLPRPLPAPRPPRGPERPAVSVIVPARNEAHNVARVLGSLTASRYPDFEVLLVDDRSEDATAALARALPPGNARRLEVVRGEELPGGWIGKPWACRQGALHAAGELLLFTDADTIHGPDLLERAVAGLEEDGADALTVIGRQIMGSFWERLVQPHVFTSMVLRYPRQSRPLPRGRWRGAIANGQYLLFRRAAYDAIGGHAAVAGEVVEDLKLAQRLVRTGHTLSMRRAEDDLGTRMYRSLGELVAGWSKNILLGGLATVPPGLLRALTPAGVIGGGVALWMLPPAALLAALLGAGGSGLLAWSGTVTAVSALLWAAIALRAGTSPLYGALYPLGAAVMIWIFLRAWARGPRVTWKGREYRVAGIDAADVDRIAGAPSRGHLRSDS